MREMLQRNARGIIVALLGIGLVTAVLTASSDDATNNTDTNDSSSEVANAEDKSSENQDDEATLEDSENVESNDQADEDDQEVVTSEIVTNDEGYSAKAAAGDSQTSIVRRIVAQVSDAQPDDEKFSDEQKLFMETYIVDQLGRDDLVFVGDEVKVDAKTVTEAGKMAKDLTDEQIALWSTYL